MKFTLGEGPHIRGSRWVDGGDDNGTDVNYIFYDDHYNDDKVMIMVMIMIMVGL